MAASRWGIAAAAGGAIGLLATSAASFGADRTGTLTFNSFSTGQKIDTEYVGEYGITISAVNAGGGPNVATLYNSGSTGGADAQLIKPFDTGNLAPGNSLSKLLVIAANDTDANGDGKIDRPDDQATRPAGSLVFDFANPIMCFGFDLINVSGLTSTSGDRGYSVQFVTDGSTVGTVGFDDLVTPGNRFYDSTIDFGANSANRVQPILASLFGATHYDRVIINLGGPGALDNANWKDIFIPEPGSLALLGLAAPALLMRRRVHR